MRVGLHLLVAKKVGHGTDCRHPSSTPAAGTAVAVPAGASSRPVLSGLFVVGLAAAGLGDPAADHVTDSQNCHVQPYAVGAERIMVGAVTARLRDRAGDQNSGEANDVSDELGRLE